MLVTLSLRRLRNDIKEGITTEAQNSSKPSQPPLSLSDGSNTGNRHFKICSQEQSPQNNEVRLDGCQKGDWLCQPA